VQPLAATGISRRTAQDTLSALGELDIDCAFEQDAGGSALAIRQLGGVNRQWIASNLAQIKATLGYP
jgi:hypothetical protein